MKPSVFILQDLNSCPVHIITIIHVKFNTYSFSGFLNHPFTGMVEEIAAISAENNL